MGVSHFKGWGIASKIMGITAFSFIASGLMIFYFSTQMMRQRAMEALVAKSRAICQIAENTRNLVAEARGQYRVYNDERMIEEVKQLREKKGGLLSLADIRETALYQTIPVVSGWRVAIKKAQESGYSFRTPSFNPRNPENEPNPFEAEMLRQ
jgi:methyl-accepting chemotaxis protein